MTKSTRENNVQIALRYDELPYDPAPHPALYPERLMGLAAVYGCSAKIGDVFDLGCGTGVELARMGAVTAGRLVGADLSRSAIELAKTRCAPFGDRARLLHADIMDLDPDDLGQFDLILHIGVIYVTPPEVRRQILHLIARCLKPGGVAVMSYYAGSVATLRASLHRMLRAARSAGATTAQAVAQARAQLAAIAEGLPAENVGRPLLLQVIENTRANDDSVFFHEVLNHAFDALPTTEIEAAMAEEGVSFLTYIGGPKVGARATSGERALSADLLDFQGGDYRHAVYGRQSAPGGPNLRAPSLRWRSALTRQGAADYGAGGAFHLAERGVEITIGSSLVQAVIDGLTETPANWDSMVSSARLRLGAAAEAIDERALAVLETDLAELWRLGAVEPFAEV